jgi:hypothetical protein
MGIDREGFLPEGGVEHDVGGLAADAGQGGQRVAILRHLAAEIAHQYFGQGDDILRLGVEQSDRLDVLLERILAQIDHLLRRFDLAEQGAGRLVDADIGGLRRQGDGDQQLIGIAIFQLRHRGGIGLCQAAEKVEDLALVHGIRAPARPSCHSGRPAGRRASGHP